MPYSAPVPNSIHLLSFPPLPKPGARIDLPSLAGSSDALALAEIAGRNTGKLLAVITASAADAQRLLDEIPWFAPNLRVRQLPDWETLPYDHFSPHQDLVSERLATLWSTLQGQVDILLVPASTAVNRLAPPEFMAAYTFEFKKVQKLDAEKFRSQVTLAGYAHVTQVVSPGEYSRSKASRPLTWTPSARFTRCPKSASCRHANSRWTTRVARISVRLSASVSRATRPNRASTRTFPPALPALVSVL